VKGECFHQRGRKLRRGREVRERVECEGVRVLV
jgi:hypothetical protein